VGTATVLSFLIGTGLGVLSGWRRGSWTDALLPATAFLSSIPYFWLGLIAITVLAGQGGPFPSGGGFDPDRTDLQDRLAYRRRWNLPTGTPLALFAGMPQPHKGWPTLLEALAKPSTGSWHLVLAGPADHDDFAAARRVLGERCHLLGPQPHGSMPLLLAAVDAVPVPQLDTPFARSQLPAKAVEAMAMARPVVATRVGDLPEILGDGARGWLIPSGDAPALAAALDDIVAQPARAEARGRAARRWYLEEASPAVIASRILELIDRVARSTAPARAEVA